MKTPIHTLRLLFLMLGMLLPVLPCFAVTEPSSMSTEIKEAAIASTPRIYVVGDCVIVKKDTGEIIKQCLLPISSGTGILIDKEERNAYVLTNAHVVTDENQLVGELDMEDGTKVAIICKRPYHLAFFPNGNHDPRIYVAQEVVCKDLQDNERNSIDAAVLRISSDGLPPVHIIDVSELEATQPVVALGYPGVLDRGTSLRELTSETNPLLKALERKLDNFTYNGGYITIELNVSDRDFINTSVTTGTIGRYDKTPGLPQRIIHSAAIGQGCSGGPLIDPRTGYVVGMNTWGSHEHAAASIAQSATTLTGFLDRNNIRYKTPSNDSSTGFLIVGGCLVVLVLVLLIWKACAKGKPCVTLYVDGRSFPLSMGKLRQGVLIGRSSQAEVSLPHPTVSSRHARLLMRNGKLFIEDIGSKGGTKVNGTPLRPHSPEPLRRGSTITLTNIDVRVD